GELLRVLEEVHDLLDLGLGLVEPGDVLERELLPVDRVEQARLALADVEHLLARPAHAAEEEDPEEDEEGEREDPREQAAEPVLLGLGGERYALRGLAGADGLVVRGEEAGEVVVL